MTLTPKLKRNSALTVAELLAVIVCTGVFGLLLFPLVPTAHKDLLADHGMLQAVVVATSSYHTDYGAFPPLRAPGEPPSSPGTDQWVGDPRMGAPLHNNALFFTLRNIPKGPNSGHAANPQKVHYLVARVAILVDGKPRSGFYDQGRDGAPPPPELDGCLFDSSGREFGVIFDTTHDDQIDVGSIYLDLKANLPKNHVGAFSSGKDGMLGTNGDRKFGRPERTSDDVVSWE